MTLDDCMPSDFIFYKLRGISVEHEDISNMFPGKIQHHI